MPSIVALTKPVNTDYLFQKYYYSLASFSDGTGQFHSMCSRRIAPGSRILEFGSGPTNTTTAFLASLGTVDGVDVSPEIRRNCHLATAREYDGATVPFADNSFDACVSNYVLEHICQPARHFHEVARVLKSGGVYCFRSPNLWHYVTLASKCFPYVLHLKFSNAMRRLGAEASDPYPTVYAANTVREIRRLCSQAGLTIADLQMVEKEPWYGRAHPALFFPMMAYERIVNGAELFRSLRANIFATVQKPEHLGPS